MPRPIPDRPLTLGDVPTLLRQIPAPVVMLLRDVQRRDPDTIDRWLRSLPAEDCR